MYHGTEASPAGERGRVLEMKGLSPPGLHFWLARILLGQDLNLKFS